MIYFKALHKNPRGTVPGWPISHKSFGNSFTEWLKDGGQRQPQSLQTNPLLTAGPAPRLCWSRPGTAKPPNTETSPPLWVPTTSFSWRKTFFALIFNQNFLYHSCDHCHCLLASHCALTRLNMEATNEVLRVGDLPQPHIGYPEGKKGLSLLSEVNPPCILGPCGVVPLAGSSDVLIPDGPLVHPQGISTDCCKWEHRQTKMSAHFF